MPNILSVYEFLFIFYYHLLRIKKSKQQRNEYDKGLRKIQIETVYVEGFLQRMSCTDKQGEIYNDGNMHKFYIVTAID